MRWMLSLLLVALLAGACKSPPPHTDSTKGTAKSDRDTGMHDSKM